MRTSDMNVLCNQTSSLALAIAALGLLTATGKASNETNGPNGINSDGLGLTGDGVSLGQVELTRPGDAGFDDPTNSTPGITLEDRFIQDGLTVAPEANRREEFVEEIDNVDVAHATEVASVLFSSNAGNPGVAPGVKLYSAGVDVVGLPAIQDRAQLATQVVATQDNERVRAINLSFQQQASQRDGNAPFTKFIDWSASRHDVLYVSAMKNTGTIMDILNTAPTDNFNGITVASSSKVLGVYRQASVFNDYSRDAAGDRTSVDILAPGDGIEVDTIASLFPVPSRSGNSYAAPHVTGAVGLLQEFGAKQPSSPQWDFESERHEVMKAVLMNSADKLEDNGEREINGVEVPRGGLLGMSRTVLDTNNGNWLDSNAYPNSVDAGDSRFIPLDDEIGTGHLNVARALEQYRPGKYEANGADVPIIGWDYGTATVGTSYEKYRLDTDLAAGGFLSVTLAWDRKVEFSNDGGVIGDFDSNDTFADYVDDGLNPPDDSVINDLDLYLVPSGSFSITSAVALSIAEVGTIEHVFFQIPTSGQYEIWVDQVDSDVGNTQNYAIAWWGWDGATPVIAGDYDGSGTIDAADYALWKTAFGTAVTPGTGADGNGDGFVDAADYTIWRDNFGASAAHNSTSVPEPSSVLLLMAGLLAFAGQGRLRRVG